MNKITSLLFIAALLSSCGHQHEFWSIDAFYVSKNAIPDSTAVQVIQYSDGPFDDEVHDGFYRHAVVVIPSSADTFNVLTFPNPELASGVGTLLLYNDHPRVDHLMKDLELLNESVEVKELMKKVNLDKAKWPVYDKVYRNQEMDPYINKKYKTVIGSLTQP